MRARARAERFFADRRSEDGRVALELVAEAERPAAGRQRARCGCASSSTSRIGAWAEARTLVARLLELMPGDPHARGALPRARRSLRTARRRSSRRCATVEKTGRLVDEERRGRRRGRDRQPLHPPAAARSCVLRGRARGDLRARRDRPRPGAEGRDRRAHGARRARDRLEVPHRGAPARARRGHEVGIEGGFGTLLGGAGGSWARGPSGRRQRAARARAPHARGPGEPRRPQIAEEEQ